jgi:hypothetical protein
MGNGHFGHRFQLRPPVVGEPESTRRLLLAIAAFASGLETPCDFVILTLVMVAPAQSMLATDDVPAAPQLLG